MQKKSDYSALDSRYLRVHFIAEIQVWGVASQPKLMPDLDTFASAIMPKKLVPGLPEPSGDNFEGFLGNVTKMTPARDPKQFL